MRVSIFRKAEKLKDKVICEGEAHNRIFFTFKDIPNPPRISLFCNGQYTCLESCTCQAHSIHGGMPQVDMKNLCSYVLAVYKTLPMKNDLLK
jgi:hypothetical protein